MLRLDREKDNQRQDRDAWKQLIRPRETVAHYKVHMQSVELFCLTTKFVKKKPVLNKNKSLKSGGA